MVLKPLPVKAVKPLRALVVCERFGRVRTALRALGHEAYSCDLADDPEAPTGHHLAEDALPLRAVTNWTYEDASDELSVLHKSDDRAMLRSKTGWGTAYEIARQWAGEVTV